MTAIGRLLGIAVKEHHRAPMRTLDTVEVVAGRGVSGDYMGDKRPDRGVSVLAREDWQAALDVLSAAKGRDVVLPWLARRANMLVAGVRLPRARGGVIRVGEVVLEVRAPALPCSRMEEAAPGLLKALYPEWRGGVCCRVVAGGSARIGDEVEVLVSPPERVIRLPG